MNFKTEKLHPVSLVIFFAEALVLCFYESTAGLGVIFSVLFIYSLRKKSLKNILWALPLAVFILILNPLFNHSGETVLFTVWGRNFTLEAILSGAYSALLIICTMLIFMMINFILSEEKFLYVFSRFLPKISLMISMIFRHFDILKKSYNQTKEMALVNGCLDEKAPLFARLKANAVIFEAFTSSALEGSIETGLSLVSKGYYSKNKTRMRKYSFALSDALFLLIESSLFALCFFKSYYFLFALGVFFLIPAIFSEGGKEK